jgi:hypothetical protein
MIKKLFAVLILVGGGVFSYQWMHQPPHFDGIFADTKLALWKFQHTVDDGEKMKIAVGLKLRPSDDLTDEEKVLAAQATQLATQVEDEVALFESKLTREDADWITKDNPDSLSHITGELPTRESPCTDEEYRAIRDRVDIRELASRSEDVMTLAFDQEQPFLGQYRAKRLELLRTDNRFSEYRKAGEAYYALHDEILQKASSDPSFVEKLKMSQSKAEEDLSRTGLKPEEMKAYVLRMAKLGPHCLTRPNQKFKEALNKDITIQRGRFLLGKLQEYIAVTGKADASLDDLPLDSSDPLFGSTNDAWSRPFQLVKDPGGRLSLRSGDLVIDSPAMAPASLPTGFSGSR